MNVHLMPQEKRESTNLVIPPSYGQEEAIWMPGNAANPKAWVLLWGEGCNEVARQSHYMKLILGAIRFRNTEAW